MAAIYGLVFLLLLLIDTTWAQDADITIHAHPRGPHYTLLPPISNSTSTNSRSNYTISPWILRGQPLSTVIFNRKNDSRPHTERPLHLPHPVINGPSTYPRFDATRNGNQDRHGFWRWIFSGGHWHHEFVVQANASWHNEPTGQVREFTSTTQTPYSGSHHVRYQHNSVDNGPGGDSESGEGSASSGSGSYSGSEGSRGSSSGGSGESASSEDHSGSDSGSGSSEGSLLSSPGHRASILHRPGITG